MPAGLTLGDFALVRRKAELLGEARPAALAAWLDEELVAKGGTRTLVDFKPVAKAIRPEPGLQHEA